MDQGILFPKPYLDRIKHISSRENGYGLQDRTSGEEPISGLDDLNA